MTSAAQMNQNKKEQREAKEKNAVENGVCARFRFFPFLLFCASYILIVI